MSFIKENGLNFDQIYFWPNFNYIVLKVAFRVQIWKKFFCQNSDKFCYSFIKNDIMLMYLLYCMKISRHENFAVSQSS